MKRSLTVHGVATLVAFASLLSTTASRAEGPCAGPVSRDDAVACAVRASLTVLAEERGQDAVEGRRRSAGVVLPSNPVLSGTIGHSTVAGDNDVDWTATLSQEIAIGGQRGARLDVANAEREAQLRRIAAARREAAAAALEAYFDALAAREEMRLAERVVALANALSVLAHGRAENGLGSLVDADVADAAASRLRQTHFTAERRVAATSAALTALVGLDPSRQRVEAIGDLAPIAVPEGDAASLAGLAVDRRAEVAVAEAERRTQERRTELLRASRIPNLTLSVFALNDRVNQRVIGGGLSVPIPLPEPVGRTHAGAIAESEALARRAATETERLRRAVRLEAVTALDALASRRREVTLFEGDKVARAEAAVLAITRELEARRLSVRDALLSQQALVDLLQASVDAKLRLCLASVGAARALGASLEGGAR